MNVSSSSDDYSLWEGGDREGRDTHGTEGKRAASARPARRQVEGKTRQEQTGAGAAAGAAAGASSKVNDLQVRKTTEARQGQVLQLTMEIARERHESAGRTWTPRRAIK
jgi:hypothetical protein